MPHSSVPHVLVSVATAALILFSCSDPGSSIGDGGPSRDAPAVDATPPAHRLFAGAARIDITPIVNRCDPRDPNCTGHCGTCRSLDRCICSRATPGDPALPEECDPIAESANCANCACLTLTGFTSRWGRTIEAVHDPIYARAIALEQRDETGATVARAALVSVESLLVRPELADGLWQALTTDCDEADCIDVPREHFWVSATHTHGGVGEGTTADALAYLDARRRQLLEVTRAAFASIQPAEIAFGRARFAWDTAGDDMNANRRPVTRPNTPFPQQPLDEGCDDVLGLRCICDINSVDPDLPSDDGVDVLALRGVDGTRIALYVNYGVHGTLLGEHNDLLTGDLPGGISRALETGGEAAWDVVAFVSSGGGDQSPQPVWSLTQREGFGTRDAPKDATLRGDAMADFVRSTVLPELEWSSDISLAGSRVPVTTPRPPEPGSDGPNRGVTKLAVAAMRLTPEVALVGLPLETAAEIAMRIKALPAFDRVALFSYTNGRRGYFVPEHSWHSYPEYDCYENGRTEIGPANDAIPRSGEELVMEGIRDALTRVGGAP